MIKIIKENSLLAIMLASNIEKLGKVTAPVTRNLSSILFINKKEQNLFEVSSKVNYKNLWLIITSKKIGNSQVMVKGLYYLK